MDFDLDSSVKAMKKERRHTVRRATKPKSKDLRTLLNKRSQKTVKLGTSLTVDNIKYSVTNNDLNVFLILFLSLFVDYSIFKNNLFPPLSEYLSFLIQF